MEDALGTGKVLLNWGVVNNCTDSTHLLSTCYVLGAALRAGVETGMDGHSSPVRRGRPAQETGRVVTPLQVVIPAMKETNKKQREREKGDLRPWEGFSEEAACKPRLKGQESESR